MIVFGLVLLIIGFVAAIPIVWSIGVIVLVVGLVLHASRGVGPRRRGSTTLLLG
jgi:hypothetical protein